MKPPPFTFHDPRSIDEAVGLLAEKDNAKILAGGQSLMPMLNMRFVLPDDVIDINKIDDLTYIRDDGDALVFGGMTPSTRDRVLRSRRTKNTANAGGYTSGWSSPDPK